MENTGPATESQLVIKKKPETLAPDLMKLGNDLVIKIHLLTKLSQIYASNNLALRQFIQESLQTINTLIRREERLSLKILNGDLFLNGQRLRYSVEGAASFKNLLTHWENRQIGEVVFNQLVDERTLIGFISTLANLEEGRRENADFFTRQLLNSGISSIDVNPLEISEANAGVTFHVEDQQERAKKVFFGIISAVKGLMVRVDQLMVNEKTQYVDARKLKRLVQKTVNLVLEDDSWLLGMASIKNYDEYTFNHSVNVAIYSLAIGRRLGFSRRTLAELGISALLHDIGKSRIPLEILNKPASLDENEWEVMKKHPLEGVETVLVLKQLGEINARIVFGIFEHHLNNNLSGYPKLFWKKELNLFGQIIRITDTYDAMTTPRIYRKNPYTPEQALGVMWGESGINFNPTLLKIFIGLVGTYPIGSLVLLDTHDLGIVYKCHPRWAARPQVILLAQEEKGYRKKELIDLTKTDEEGRFRWSIIKTLDPSKFHIDIGKYFL
jgi:HD-GYP domain-containing protein (c-di-GMP phosphodiesterase class II)